jgi:hypothetical protein
VWGQETRGGQEEVVKDGARGLGEDKNRTIRRCCKGGSGRQGEDKKSLFRVRLWDLGRTRTGC